MNKLTPNNHRGLYLHLFVALITFSLVRARRGLGFPGNESETIIDMGNESETIVDMGHYIILVDSCYVLSAD